MPRSKTASAPAPAPASAPAPSPSPSPKLRATKSAPAALAPARPIQSPEAPGTPSPPTSPSELPDFVQMFHAFSRQSAKNAQLYSEAILRLQNTSKAFAHPTAKTAASRLLFQNINEYVQSELNKIQVIILLAIGSSESEDAVEIMSFGDHLDSITDILYDLDIYLNRFVPEKKAILLAESGLPKIQAALDRIIAKAYADDLVFDGSDRRRLLKFAATVTEVQKKFGTIAEKVFTGGAARARRPSAAKPKK